MNKILHNNKLLTIIATFLVVITMGVLTYLLQRPQDPRSRATGEYVQLKFDPTFQTLAANTDFTTKIIIDSGELSITGVDLTFDIDVNTLSFVSFTPSSSLNSTLINSLDPETHSFRFAAVDTSSNKISGMVELGTLNLQSKSSGTGEIKLTRSQVTVSELSTAVPVTIPTPATYTIDASGTTPHPTATPIISDNPLLKLNIFLHGIGKAGDLLNPISTLNKVPTSQERDIQVTIKDTSPLPSTLTLPGKVIYDTEKGSFTGMVDTGTALSGGDYEIQIKIPGYIEASSSASHIFSLKSRQTTEIPPIYFITGDSNRDGNINMLDYNFILDCYSDLHPPLACDADKKPKADLNDDSKVDAVDYNLFIREVSNL